MVFRFKCYNLPFFGWWDGNVDKYSLFLFFFHVILSQLVSICAKLQTSSASASILINFFKVTTPPHVCKIIYHTKCAATQYKSK